MEPVGAAASAFALLGIASQVINGIRTATTAEKDRRRLRDEMRAIESVLQQLTDEIADADEANAWRETTAALEAPNGPFSRLQTVLTQLLNKLQAETGAKKAISSLKWPFKQDEVKEALVVMERERSLLHLALSNNSRKLVQEIKTTAKANQKTLDLLLASLAQESASNATRLDHIQGHLGAIRSTGETARLELERQKILHWLSPIDHTTQQSDFIRRRQPGSGTWFLNSNEYQKWVKDTNQTLFCPGIPGAGKTMISSVVIQDLVERSQGDPEIGVAFLYCNFNRHDEQNIEDLLGSIARQLLDDQEPLPPSLADLYEKHGRKRKPSLEEICLTLDAATQLCGRVFVVMDALDEYQRRTRSAFLEHIFKVQSSQGLNLFMTSRFLPEITDRFDPKATLEVRANEDDLRLFLQDQMLEMPFCVQDCEELQQGVQTAIIKATRGMFLLAHLHVQSLGGKSSHREIRTALEKLPKGTDSYDAAYDAVMHRIKSQLPGQAKLAMRVLGWIARAGRELSMEQLQTALAIEPDDQHLDAEDMPNLKNVLSEYFDRTWSRWFPDAENEMGVACVTYLLFPGLRSTAWSISDRDDSREDDRDPNFCIDQACNEAHLRKMRLNRMLRDNPFYVFAAISWARYARDITNPWPRLVEFLDCPEAFHGTFEVLFAAGDYAPQSISHPSGGIDQVTTSHLLAVVGLPNLLHQMPSQLPSIDAKDSWGMTPLMHAAYAGHLSMVTYLLKHGADRILQNNSQNTALSLACAAGNLGVVEILLQAGADILNMRNIHGNTPLVCAVRAGHLAVVERLLATGKVDVETKTRDYSPLTIAAGDGQLEICRALIVKGGANINRLSGRRSKTRPLINALRKYEIPTARLLLGLGNIQVNLRDSEGDTALHVAAKTENDEMTRLLIEARDADVTARNEKGLTPLLACGSCRVLLSSFDVLEALLSAEGIEPDARDLEGRSLLSCIVLQLLPRTCNKPSLVDFRGQVMKRLVATDKVDINSQDNQGRTPLHHAALAGDLRAVEQLLQFDGINPGITDSKGHTPLVALISSEIQPPRWHKMDLKFLAILMMGFEASTSDVFSLLKTIEPGLNDAIPSTDENPPCEFNDLGKRRMDWILIARRLLEANGTEFDRRSQGQTTTAGPALVFACENNADGYMMRELIDFGAAVDSQDCKGISALSHVLANERGQEMFVEILLSAGANTESTDHLGRTALGCIGKKTKAESIRLLVEHGADIHAKDLRGQTPLMKAVLCVDSVEIVTMLLKVGARVDGLDEDGHDVFWHAREATPPHQLSRVIEVLEKSHDEAATGGNGGQEASPGETRSPSNVDRGGPQTSPVAIDLQAGGDNEE